MSDLLIKLYEVDDQLKVGLSANLSKADFKKMGEWLTDAIDLFEDEDFTENLKVNQYKALEWIHDYTYSDELAEFPEQVARWLNSTVKDGWKNNFKKFIADYKSLGQEMKKQMMGDGIVKMVSLLEKKIKK